VARARPLLILPFFLLAATACSSSGSDDSRSAEQLATDAAAAMAEVSSVAFTVEHDGTDVFIDEAGLVSFEAAEGHYTEPGAAEAVVAVRAGGFRTEVGAVAIDDEMWMTDPLTGAWGDAPAAFAFNPARLFDADDGLSALLSDNATTAELGESEGDDGPEGHHLRMTVPREQITDLSGGLIDDDTRTDLWIDPDTDRLVALAFEVSDGEETSTWRFALDDYGAQVTVEPPDLETPR
jgi:lipoprotein LprG